MAYYFELIGIIVLSWSSFLVLRIGSVVHKLCHFVYLDDS